MPVGLVIDYGEPQKSRDNYDLGNGITYDKYSDGVLHDYVGILYRADDKKAAEELGDKVADRLESIMDYFDHCNAEVAAQNPRDFISAMNNYLLLATYSADAEHGLPNGKLAKRTNKYANHLFKDILTKMYDELKNEALDNGDNINVGGKTGAYGKRYQDFKGHTEAVGIEFGFLKANEEVPPPSVDPAAGKLSPDQLRQMIEAQK